MDKILYIIKWAVLIEIFLVCLFILMAYVFKGVFVVKDKLQQKRIINIRNYFQSLLKNDGVFSKKKTNFLGRHLGDTLSVLNEFDRKNLLAGAENFFTEIIQNIIFPKARKFATSRNWFKRYLAANSFNFSKISGSDESLIVNLISDPIPLVSIYATRAAFRSPSQKTIDAIIVHYSQGRYLLQTAYAKIFSDTPNIISCIPFVYKHIESTSNPYDKAFCYRFLTDLPLYASICPTLEADIQTDVLELKLAALNYLAHQHSLKAPEILNKSLNDPHWEVRAIAAKLLGKLKEIQSAESIERLLHDPEWWVRLNAAQALSELGEIGFSILKSQNSQKDLFAYEAAQYVLVAIANQACS